MFRLCIKHTRAATTNCAGPFNLSDYCYRDLRSAIEFTRNFSTRNRRQSIGLGTSGSKLTDHDSKINELYNDNRLERLWRDTFERLSLAQHARRRERESIDHQKQNLDPSSRESYRNIYDTGVMSRSSGAKSNQEELGLGSVNQNRKSSSFSPDDQHLMKLSFAEGYFYGQEFKKKKGSRLLAIIKDTTFFAVMIVSLYALFGGNSPIKRSLIGRSFEIQPEMIDVSFNDVKGCDEAKQELTDIVEFLKNPNKFTRLGGKLPKGVLLVGPPGTGKTLLARAVAGEAGVPFFHASGSEFDEMLVGQGARRVRDLFAKAKQRTPCVIFIDEIDSVGGKRSSSVLHPYANQTINQLLNEMDGFSQNDGVIVIGATNRESDLDQALMRPGRFDVQVTVPVPEYSGRKELIEFYLEKVRASNDIDIDTLCRKTIGLTGADIENIVNQAALKSATDNKDKVTQKSIEYALDKVLMGPEKRKVIPDREQNLITAYHEGGHALVAYYTKNANSLHKVTIVGRNRSLGHTATLPERDLNHKTREHLAATIDVCLGGRIAEELIYGSERVTTGAASDLQTANRLATQMVKDFGMSEKIGVRVVQDDSTNPYSQIVVNNVSGTTSDLVESEIIRLLDESRERVRTLLSEHKNELKLLAEALLKYETLDAAEVKLVIEGKDPKALRQDRDKRAKTSNLKPVTNPPDGIPLDLLK